MADVEMANDPMAPTEAPMLPEMTPPLIAAAAAADTVEEAALLEQAQQQPTVLAEDVNMAEMPETLNAQKAGSVKPEQQSAMIEDTREATPANVQTATSSSALPEASADDDLLSDILLDRIRFPAGDKRTRKINLGYQRVEIDMAPIFIILRNLARLQNSRPNKRMAAMDKAAEDFKALPVYEEHISSFRGPEKPKRLQAFEVHLRRYLETYLPNRGFNYVLTCQYNSKSPKEVASKAEEGPLSDSMPAAPPVDHPVASTSTLPLPAVSVLAAEEQALLSNSTSSHSSETSELGLQASVLGSHAPSSLASEEIPPAVNVSAEATEIPTAASSCLTSAMDVSMSTPADDLADQTADSESAIATQLLADMPTLERPLSRVSEAESALSDISQEPTPAVESPPEEPLDEKFENDSPLLDLAIKATRIFQVGEVIPSLKGTLADLTAKQDDDLRQDVNGMQSDFSVLYNPTRKVFQLLLGPARFCNHDCEANVIMVRKGTSICFKVIKKVLPGDEICSFYGDDYFDDQNINCMCATCERLMRGVFTVPGQERRRKSTFKEAPLDGVKRTRKQSEKHLEETREPLRHLAPDPRFDMEKPEPDSEIEADEDSGSEEDEAVYDVKLVRVRPKPAEKTWAFAPTNIIVDKFKLDETRSGTRSGRKIRQTDTDELTPDQQELRRKMFDSTGAAKRKTKRKRGPHEEGEEDSPEEEVVVVTEFSYITDSARFHKMTNWKAGEWQGREEEESSEAKAKVLEAAAKDKFEREERKAKAEQERLHALAKREAKRAAAKERALLAPKREKKVKDPNDKARPKKRARKSQPKIKAEERESRESSLSSLEETEAEISPEPDLVPATLVVASPGKTAPKKAARRQTLGANEMPARTGRQQFLHDRAQLWIDPDLQKWEYDLDWDSDYEAQNHRTGVVIKVKGRKTLERLAAAHAKKRLPVSRSAEVKQSPARRPRHTM